MNYYKIIGIVILFCFPFFASSQITDAEMEKLISGGTEAELVTKNSSLIQEEILAPAEKIADKLLAIKPESSNYNYRKGFLVIKVRTDYDAAIPYLQKAVKNVSQNYDMYSANEKNAPIDAYYHLAVCYHLKQQLDSATKYYNLFLQNSLKKSELIDKAKLGIKQIENAKNMIASPVNIYLKNIGHAVNTEYPEYSPVVSLDGASLYFTSRRPWENGETERFKDETIDQYPEDVYVSYMDFDSTWMQPVRLEFCEPKRNEATIAVSTDERRIYLYEDSTGNGDIYYTDFYANKFNNITKLEGEGINTDFWETHIMVSPDRSLMFLVSDRPGGYGGRDIYISRRKNDTTWTKPENLGPSINTPYDEDAPFVSVDNKRLYFSSNGEKSMGGFDIMYSDIIEEKSFTDSKNLGYPFNSTNDDIFYTTTIDGLKGYMTSFRSDGYGEKDIYEIHNDYLGIKNIAVFKGKIKTTDGSPLPEDFAMNIQLSCDDCDDYEKNRVIFPRLRDGAFMSGLNPCKTYHVAYFNATDKKVMYEESFTTKCDEEYQEIYRELMLDVANRRIFVPKDTVKTLDTIPVNQFKNLEYVHYFDYNKNKISVKKGELKSFINDVEAQLKEGRTSITINIYSSASQVPTETYGTNSILANLRAENMKYDLISYFESNPAYKGKVNVVIVSAIVDGPIYEKDPKNKKRYTPYQFVALKTE